MKSLPLSLLDRASVAAENGEPERGHALWLASMAAFCLGLLTVAGFAPYGWFALPLLTLALLFRLWQAAPTLKRTVALGFLWGLGCYGGGVYWIYIGLHDTGGLRPLYAGAATLGFVGTLALFPALAGGLYARFRSEHRWRNAWLIAAAWTLAEWLRGWVLSGFPWLSIGYSQGPASPLSGFAPVAGVYGLGFICALLAAAVAGARGLSENALALGAALVVLVGGLLLHRVDWTRPVGLPLSVSLLQGDIPQDKKWDQAWVQRTLDTYARLAGAHPAQLTVLPETSLPMFMPSVPQDYLRMLTRNGPALIGIADFTGPSDHPTGLFNAAVAVANGERRQSYEKVHLVPFGEYTPALFAWFERLLHIPLREFGPGPVAQQPLELAGQQIAPTICFEDLFGENVIRSLPQATLLVNLSNMGWFGNSLALPQHLQIAQMRAMESGRWLLLAANTGMTGAIGPDGQVRALLPAFESAGLTVDVQSRSGSTPYVRWGNGLVLLLIALGLLPSLAARRQPTQ